jgi:general secretion pathway protein D
VRRLALAALVLTILNGCAAWHSPDARYGDQLRLAGRWDEAVQAYQRALKDEPFSQAVQTNLALARAQASSQHREKAKEFQAQGKWEEARQTFKRALMYEPMNADNQAGYEQMSRLKEAEGLYQEGIKLEHLGRTHEALEKYEQALELEPSFSPAVAAITALAKQDAMGEADERLRKPITLRFPNARIKDVFDMLAQAGNFNFAFDKDVKNDTVSIFIEDMPFDEALNLVLTSNGLFGRRVNANTFLISPNTKPKHEQYQDLMVRTFYLSTVKAKDMVNLVRTMLDVKRMYANEDINAVVVRDQPEKLQLVERIILANDRRESEVLLEVEVLEVNRTRTQKYGLTYAKQASLSIAPDGGAAGQFLYRQLKNLGDASYLFKLPGDIQLDYFKQDSDAKTLASPKLRVLNNKKAEINIGDKQPILLSTTNVLPGQAANGATPTTSTVTAIEFKDTGIKLLVEPNIHLAKELNLKMRVEVTRLGDEVTLQASPVIKQFRFGTRTAETVLSMKDGETIVLAGLLQDEDRKTRVTIPWIGDLPLIGNLLSSFSTETVTTEVILTITPHIIHHMTPPTVQAQSFWSGTEMTFSTAPLFKPLLGATHTHQARQETPKEKPGKAHASPAGLTKPTVTTPAQAGRMLVLRSSEVIGTVGELVRLDLGLSGNGPIATERFVVEYDPDVLTFERAERDGQVLSSDEHAGLTVRPDSEPGRLLVLVPDSTQVLAGKSLATLSFTTHLQGVAQVRIQQTEVGEAKESSSNLTMALIRVR